MARRYARSASKDVEREMHKFKRGTLKSGKGGKGGTVKSRRQAIAIGLSEARREGKRVPAGPAWAARRERRAHAPPKRPRERDNVAQDRKVRRLCQASKKAIFTPHAAAPVSRRPAGPPSRVRGLLLAWRAS